MKNNFFKKNVNVKINDILKVLNQKKQNKNFLVDDIKELELAKKNDITFLHSAKYLDILKNSNAKLIITNQKFKNKIPKGIKIILVSNVLLSVATVTSLFYPTYSMFPFC